MEKEDKLVLAHLDEMHRKGAEPYNLGWAQGEDFISSKTDKGRLHTNLDRRVGGNKIVHQWE
jgi:hypothetical protein